MGSGKARLHAYRLLIRFGAKQVRIVVETAHLPTAFVMTEGAPDGVSVTLHPINASRSVEVEAIATVVISVAGSVAVNLLSSWLYDKLKGKPKTKLTINRTEVLVVRDEIVRVVHEEINKEE